MSSVFFRNFNVHLPEISHGEGVYLFDKSGRRYLDAVGGAAVVAIGHGVRQITDAVARHGPEMPYVYSAAFTHRWQEELAASLIRIASPNMAAVYFVTGGSEANETAIKMARQYFLQRGIASKYKILSRQQSFHGVTLATLSISGRPSWRAPYSPFLWSSPAIAAPYCYRCPLNLRHPQCNTACADDLERAVLQENPGTIAAFIVEPISGTSLTGVTPVPDYYSKVREICDRYDILLIADEVFTGLGRTGKAFAIQHWGIEPDIITCGKALGSGYAPIAAVLAAQKIVDAYRSGTGEFTHGFTFNGHPLSCFVGLQVLQYMEENHLFQRAAQLGSYLMERLEDLAARHPIIGDVRGKGLLAGIEFVADRASRRPLPASAEVTQRVVWGALDEGVIVIPGSPGINHGRGGDHIQITPPYVVSSDQLDEIVRALDTSITRVEREVF